MPELFKEACTQAPTHNGLVAQCSSYNRGKIVPRRFSKFVRYNLIEPPHPIVSASSATSDTRRYYISKFHNGPNFFPTNAQELTQGCVYSLLYTSLTHNRCHGLTVIAPPRHLVTEHEASFASFCFNLPTCLHSGLFILQMNTVIFF